MNNAYPRVFSVSSGKGGVGKTNISVNLAYCLSRMGYKVLLLDADLGLGNVDVMLGLTPEYSLFSLFNQEISLDKVIYPTGYGFDILPAGSGIQEMLSLNTGQKLVLLEEMDVIEDKIDFLIVDTGAGINENVLYFNLAVQERVLVLNQDPSSLTDAYALIKVLYLSYGINTFRILVNAVGNNLAAKNVFKRLYLACDQFLDGVSLDWIGFVSEDRAVQKAVVQQKPFCYLYPEAGASKNLVEAAKKITAWELNEQSDGNIKFFWKKILFRE